ncbi:Inactivated superfamily I helicase [Campylobacter geochelonis]|nr:Inactivated superfamily I helicase [Campylobacter geochelonis]
MIKKELFVFTTARSIRAFLEKFDNEILPKTTTINTFFKECVYQPNLVECDEINRILFMQKAVVKTKNLQVSLNFPSEFFAFLKNKEYLFSFFKELAISKKDINSLQTSDTYAQYDEHLSILDELLSNYKFEVKNAGFYDDITIVDEYKINENFIKDNDEITIYIDGILSEFELEILSCIKTLTTLKLIFKTTKFNHKFIKNISNLKLKQGKEYCLNLSTNEVESEQDLSLKSEIFVRGLASQSMQCAYIFEKISTFINSGIKAQNIAVILPDEGFSELLKLYDFNNMLNFAMGTPFTKTLFYEIFSKVVLNLKEDKALNLEQDYINKAKNYDKDTLFLNSVNFDKQLYEKLKINFYKEAKFDEFKVLVDEILQLSNEPKIAKILENPLYEIEIFMQNSILSFSQIYEIFLMLISGLSVEHVGGGKVSVMGILESRGMKFDGVIIPNFNDELVPKRSVNELFLNSKVREKAGLISYLERENLQRTYYKNAILSAQKVAICYDNSDEKLHSRFLSEFGYKKDNEYSDEDYLNLFKSGGSQLNLDDDKLVFEHDFFASSMSFSRLDTYLKCPRKYAYAYILKLSPAKPLDEDEKAKNLGSALHKSLYLTYKKDINFSLKNFENALLSVKNEFGLNDLDICMALLNFKKFANLMSEFEAAGWVFKDGELKVNSKFCDIDIHGYLDRLDFNGTEYKIIDYKLSGGDKNSLQLPFYQALLDKNCQSCYLNLTTMQLVSPAKTTRDLQSVIEDLKNISNTQITFERTTKTGICNFCPYTLICKRSVQCKTF